MCEEILREPSFAGSLSRDAPHLEPISPSPDLGPSANPRPSIGVSSSQLKVEGLGKRMPMMASFALHIVVVLLVSLSPLTARPGAKPLAKSDPGGILSHFLDL